MPAQRRSRLFKEIASAPGGAARRLLDPAALNKAQKRMEALAPEALGEMREAIAVILAETDRQASVETILSRAHDVRSLAAGFGLAGPGVVAGEIRAYILNRPPPLQPDWSLLRLLAAMLDRAFERPEEASPELVAEQARALVAWAVGRKQTID